MPSRMSRAESFGLAALALLGTAGGSVFGALASEGGRDRLRNIVLGVVCAIVLVSVTAINRFIDIRFLRAGGAARERAGIARERAVAARERAATGKEGAERQAAEVQGDAEARVIIGLRARLSPALYCLGKIAAASSGTVEAPLVGSLAQAIVAAAIEHREYDVFRRSIFFAVKGDVMECACYAGYEGNQDAGRSNFRNSPDDPVGQYMFRLLGEREALLIPDVDAADLAVNFPHRRSYQTIIAAAVMAGESPAGILTLDAPQPDSLGRPDLEIMKTLATLLGVGLALGTHTNVPRLQVPAQSNREP
jgi:hypothetical protein